MRHGDAPRAAPRLRWGAAAAAGVKVMEMYVVRRPVYGGPARIGLIGMAPQGNRAGGPGVPWTPGRRPPHRNGGARRLSGYAAKSRSDAPTGGAQASPFLCFRPPYRRPLQKGWGLSLPPYSHERTTIIRYVVKKIATKLSRQVSCTATPARANKEKISVRSGGGCEVSRGVRGTGTPASQFWQRERRGGVRGSPQRGRRGGVRGHPQRTAPGRPARPILAAWAARECAGFPAKRAARGGRGVVRTARAAGQGPARRREGVAGDARPPQNPPAFPSISIKFKQNV